MRNLLLSLLVLIGLANIAHAYDGEAKSAMLVDQTTGTVLLAKNADVGLPPASMSKLMTLNMLFEALDEGRVALDTQFKVSEKATQIGGSTMFLRAGERVTVEDLIQGIIVQSGNDACVTVAEGLATTEGTFAKLMTDRAKELGMSASTFGNSTGWPHPMQRMSARDLVFLANRLITKFPQYYTYFSQETFTWDNVEQKNRNPLLGLGIGADGLKTGHTQEAGYGLVGSAVQGDRRIIFMISGLTSKAQRAKEAENLTNWAFRQFVTKDLFPKGAKVADAKVWLGSKDTVALIAPDGVQAILPASLKTPPKMEVSYEGPIEAPIKAGTKLATLTISSKGMEAKEVPLFAGSDVDAGGIVTRMKASAQILSNDLLGGRLWSSQ